MRLLVETHVHSAVVQQLANDGVDVVSLALWMGGEHRNKPDSALLEIASEADRVLVTYDIHTIPPLVKEWTEAGRRHAGIVFITGRAAQINDLERFCAASAHCSRSRATTIGEIASSI